MPDKSSKYSFSERVQISESVNSLRNAWKRYFALFCWIRDKDDNDKLPYITDFRNCKKEELEELKSYNSPVHNFFYAHTIK